MKYKEEFDSSEDEDKFWIEQAEYDKKEFYRKEELKKIDPDERSHPF
ncbi:MAG TPA: hypothetical protein VMZ91_06575 [Candidatus Paceibacterota bacterium]|nr:hypothetical protein [Candidatus Paceibacterota bacterium]